MVMAILGEALPIGFLSIAFELPLELARYESDLIRS